MRLPLLLLLATVACDEVGEDTATCTPLEGRTWNNYGSLFLAEWCWSCHSEDNPNLEVYDIPPDVTFDNEEDADRWALAIVATLEAESMPLGGGLPEEERDLAIDYFSCVPE